MLFSRTGLIQAILQEDREEMKLYLILIKFLFLGALFIVSNNHLYLSHQEDFTTFGNMYYSWMSTLFDHAKQITFFVVKSEWLPNENNESEVKKGVLDRISFGN